MKKLLLILSFFMVSVAQAKVLKLGTSTVQGELRRSQLRWIDAQAKVKQLLPQIYELKLKQIETNLLESPKRKAP